MSSETFKMAPEKEYNLNNIKEIKVTQEFLTLDENVIQCQNGEYYNDCKTRKYVDEMLMKCGCLPFNMGNFGNRV